ncbi:lysozyme inhibitor LprI family protein [Rubrivivax sp. RP6-9]|uniref:lysozyme inhibitor LprI family protein n=1 Tax=Rubrivivax sp. RP6-9 TaxID=3415750 RepID=UPI003CC620C4
MRRPFLLHTTLATIGALAAATLHAGEAPASAPAAVAVACPDAVTQAELNACADAEFQRASADYAARYRALAQDLPPAQRAQLRRMQDAWLQYRTQACRFEAGPSAGGSVQGFVYWRCAARMTRLRAAELEALGRCPEGDVACAARRR